MHVNVWSSRWDGLSGLSGLRRRIMRPTLVPGLEGLFSPGDTFE